MHWAGWIRRIRQTKKMPTIFLWPNPPAVNGYDISPFTVMSQWGKVTSYPVLDSQKLRSPCVASHPNAALQAQHLLSRGRHRADHHLFPADPRCPAIKYLTCLFAIENYHKLPITPSPGGCENLSPLLLCRLESHWKSLWGPSWWTSPIISHPVAENLGPLGPLGPSGPPGPRHCSTSAVAHRSRPATLYGPDSWNMLEPPKSAKSIQIDGMGTMGTYTI